MNIKFWLDQGTLLGAVRDGKPIDGDNDIDISINSKDFDDTLKVIKQLKEKGYHVKYQKDLPVIDDLIQVYLINDRGMLSKNHIDINIYRYTNNYYVRHGIHESLNSFANRILNIIRVLSGNRFKPKNIFLKMVLLLPLFVRIKIGLFILKIYCNFFKSISQVIPKYFFENFKEIKFLKMNFYIPDKVEQYLEYRFGKSWQIPNAGSRNKWVWPNKDDKAVKFQNLNFLDLKSINQFKGEL